MLFCLSTDDKSLDVWVYIWSHTNCSEYYNNHNNNGICFNFLLVVHIHVQTVCFGLSKASRYWTIDDG